MDICENILTDKINDSNCINTILLAKQMKSTTLEDNGLFYFKMNTGAVLSKSNMDVIFEEDNSLQNTILRIINSSTT